MRRYLCAAVLAGALAACGGASSDSGSNSGPGITNPGNGTPTPTANTVTMGVDSTFLPATLNITKGTTVTWNWPSCNDSYGYGTCVTHSVVFDDGSGIASSVQSAGTFSRNFSTAGTYRYHCGVHGTAMSGQVIVQ
jgi:plastocyanin